VSPIITPAVRSLQLPYRNKPKKPALHTSIRPAQLRGCRAVPPLNDNSFKALSFGEGLGEASLSAEKLRAKSDKTMVAKSAMAGHSRFLQKRKSQSA